MDDLEGAFTWILAGGIALGATTACLVLGGLLRAALGGGLERTHPVPPDATRHAARVTARVRAHHSARIEAAEARPPAPPMYGIPSRAGLST